MKPSHLTTPRCMEKCHFDMDADPIEVYHKDEYDSKDMLVLWGAAIALVALIVIVWVI